MTQHKNHTHPISIALRQWAEDAAVPGESEQVTKRRKVLASGSWDKAAASSDVPVEVKQLMILNTEQKGTLYNILSDQRMPWVDLMAVYEKVGGTAEAKFRLLTNKGSSLPHLLDWAGDYDKKLTPLLFSKRGVPAAAFLELMEEYGRRMEAWKGENPDWKPVLPGGRPRQHDLNWFIEAAQKWVANHQNVREVAVALGSVEDFYGKGEDVLSAFYSRQDAAWNMVKTLSEEGDYTGFVVNGFFSVKAARVPIEELEEIASGMHEVRPEARIHCLIAAYAKQPVSKLVEALDVLLLNCLEEDFTPWLGKIGADRYRNRRNRTDVGSFIFTDGNTPAERIILSLPEKSLARGLGFYSFQQTFETIREANRLAREEEGKSSATIPRGAPTQRFEWLAKRELEELQNVLTHAAGASAYAEWMEANYPEMADVPLDWAIEVLT